MKPFDSDSDSDSGHEHSVKSFENLNLSKGLSRYITKSQFERPTQIQAQALPEAMNGNDLIGISQTGTGKTLAYALAVINHLENNSSGRTLILLPNRETADQVYRVFNEILSEHGDKEKLSPCLITTGIPNATQASQLKKNPRLLIATPGRINDHLRNNKLLLQGLSLLVIDEADRILDMGFEPQLQFLQSTLRGARQTLMFAASFGAWAQPIAALFMKADAILIRSDKAEKAVSTLSQRVLFLSDSQKQNRLLDELKKMKGSVILFADSQDNCVSLGRLLLHHEFSSEFVHGNMNPGHRARVLREFREEKFQVLVTTDLLARGLDVTHVRHILNYDLPYKAEDFLHRIGRTARAGRAGSALTFVTPSDERTYRKIRSYLKGATEEIVMKNFKFVERSSTRTKLKSD